MSDNAEDRLRGKAESLAELLCGMGGSRHSFVLFATEQIHADLEAVVAEEREACQELLAAAKACLPYFDLMWPPEESGNRQRLREALRVAIEKVEGPDHE